MRPEFIKLGKRLVRKVYLQPINKEEDEATADFLYIRPLDMMEEIDVQVLSDDMVRAKKMKDHTRWKIRIEQITKLFKCTFKDEKCTKKYFDSTSDLYSLTEIQLNYLADQYDQVEDLCNPASKLLEEITDPEERQEEFDRRMVELKKNTYLGTTMSTAELLDLAQWLVALKEQEERQKPSSVSTKTSSLLDNGSTSESSKKST